MIRLIYISTARMGADDALVEAILAASRRNNARVGITGLLLFDGVRFLQALEGEAETVAAAFARIKQDPRHYAAVELSRQPIAERGFGGWTMASRRVADAGEGATLAETVDRLVAQVPDPSTRALFASFARLDRHAS